MRDRYHKSLLSPEIGPGPCSLWCRLTAPLFQHFFLDENRKPSVLAVPIGQHVLFVDENGRLIDNPDVHIRDKRAVHEYITGDPRKLTHTIMLGLALQMTYLFVFWPQLQAVAPVKLFMATAIPAVFALASMLIHILHERAHKPKGGLPRRQNPAFLRRLALFAVARLNGYDMKKRLIFIAVTALIVLALGNTIHDIAQNPPTLFVQIHLLLASLWFAFALSFTGILLLANLVFYPCLRCHGFTCKDFIISTDAGPTETNQ